MRTIIAVILIILVGWWITDKAYQKFYLHAEKKPFWSGTDEVQVCKVPYYTSDDCKRLKVELVDNKHARIHYFVTKTVKDQTEGVPTEEQFKQAYSKALMANDFKAAAIIKEANEFLNPDKNVTVEQQLDVFNLECWFTSVYQYEDEQRYVFCRSWDKSDQQWDFHPTWVTIN